MSTSVKRENESECDYKRKLRKRTNVPFYQIDNLDDDTYFEAVEKYDEMLKKKDEDEEIRHQKISEEGDGEDDDELDCVMCPKCGKVVCDTETSCDGCGHVFKYSKDGYMIDTFIQDDEDDEEEEEVVVVDEIKDEEEEGEFEFSDESSDEDGGDTDDSEDEDGAAEEDSDDEFIPRD